MSKKNYKNDHLRINLSNIINRLPLQNHISSSQNSLIELSPTWNNWCDDSLPREFHKIVTLNSFSQGVLSIRCATSVAASQLKHLQVSLLGYLNDAGHTQVKQLKIEIDRSLTYSCNGSSDSEAAKNSIGDTSTEMKIRPPLDKEAMTSLELCQRGVKNERLSASLEKLHDTLEKLKK